MESGNIVPSWCVLADGSFIFTTAEFVECFSITEQNKAFPFIHLLQSLKLGPAPRNVNTCSL